MTDEQTTASRRCGYCEGVGHIQQYGDLNRPAGLVLCTRCGGAGATPIEKQETTICRSPAAYRELARLAAKLDPEPMPADERASWRFAFMEARRGTG